MSEKKNSHIIELVILLIALMAVVWFASGQSGESVDSAQSARLLGQADQLRQQVELLHDKSTIYLEHAPRNYDDYFRDTMVIHASLQREVEVLDNAIRNHIAASPVEDQARAYLPDQGREMLIAAWTDFHDGLTEQLGVDPEMPRLEWGFRHIDEQTERLLTALDTALAPLRSQLASSGPGRAGSGMLLGGVLAWCGLMLVWFGYRVGYRK